MIERLRRELELVRARYGEVAADAEVSSLEILRFPLPPGWTHTLGRVAVVIPPGYPVTPPDNFYLDEAVVLTSGGAIGNSSPGQAVLGRIWRLFSFHVEPGTWRPTSDVERGHNLLVYLDGVKSRLKEAS